MCCTHCWSGWTLSTSCRCCLQMRSLSMHEQMPAIAERSPVNAAGHGLPLAQVRPKSNVLLFVTAPLLRRTTGMLLRMHARFLRLQLRHQLLNAAAPSHHQWQTEREPRPSAGPDDTVRAGCGRHGRGAAREPPGSGASHAVPGATAAAAVAVSPSTAGELATAAAAAAAAAASSTARTAAACGAGRPLRSSAAGDSATARTAGSRWTVAGASRPDCNGC